MNILKHRAGGVKLGNNQSYIKDENANETTLDQNAKAPSNYHVSSLNEMKKIARDHHYKFGMRG